MCRRVECSECGKPSFAGCGMHVDQVLGDVPRDERCTCNESGSDKARSGAEASSLFRRLFGA